MTTTLPLERFAHWLAYGERGMSSESIMRAATGGDPGRWGWTEPADLDDFRRCGLLLAEIPEARGAAFSRLAEGSRAWAALIERWADIVALLEEEAPDWLTERRWRAPRAGHLMRKTREETWT